MRPHLPPCSQSIVDNFPLVDHLQLSPIEVTPMVAVHSILGIGHAAEDDNGFTCRLIAGVTKHIDRHYAACGNRVEGFGQVFCPKLGWHIAEPSLKAMLPGNLWRTSMRASLWCGWWLTRMQSRRRRTMRNGMWRVARSGWHVMWIRVRMRHVATSHGMHSMVWVVGVKRVWRVVARVMGPHRHVSWMNSRWWCAAWRLACGWVTRWRWCRGCLIVCSPVAVVSSTMVSTAFIASASASAFTFFLVLPIPTGMPILTDNLRQTHIP